MKLHPGMPCTCKPGRYVRFIVQAVPGCAGVVSCRDSELTGKASLSEHPIPALAEVMIRVADFGTGGDTVRMLINGKEFS